MLGHYWDGDHSDLAAEYEADSVNVERDRSAEWHIPLSWVTAWVGAVSAISLGLGLVLKWLLQ